MEAVLLSPSGRTILESPVISIGRAAENQFVLNDPRVSLYQVELRRVRQGYTITNLASSGSAFVNAQRLEKNVPHLLAADDMLHIGSTTFRYQVSSAVEEPPLVSAQADQERALEDHSPAPVETSSNAEQEDTLPASFRAMLLSPSGRTVLESPVIGIGCAAENQLVLNNPRVSWRHAELHRVRRGYTITDLASGNGTFVNAQRLKKNVPHLLATNDMIHIEDATFRYQVGTAVEEPLLVSAQADHDLEEYSPVAVAASASTQVSSPVTQERAATPSASLASTVSTVPDQRHYPDQRTVSTAASASTQVSSPVRQERVATPPASLPPIVSTASNQRRYPDTPIPVSVPASTQVSSPVTQERAATPPASLPPKRPVLGANNRGVLFAILLTLVVIVVIVGVVLGGVTRPPVPATSQTAVTTPATSQTAVTTPGVSAPHLATSYAGTISALSTNTKTPMFLTTIQQSQGTIQGSFQGLGVVGPFTGKVTSDGQVRFSVKIPNGSMAFEGSIKEGGDIAGNYQALDSQGRNSGYGLWNVAANTLA